VSHRLAECCCVTQTGACNKCTSLPSAFNCSVSMSGLLNYYGTSRPISGSFSVRLEAASDCAGCVYSSSIFANQDHRTVWTGCSSSTPYKAAHPLHRFSAGQVNVSGSLVELFLVVFGAVLIPDAADESGIFNYGSQKGVFVCWGVDTTVSVGVSRRQVAIPPDPSFNNTSKPLYCFVGITEEQLGNGLPCWAQFGSPTFTQGSWSDRLIASGCNSPMGTYSHRNPSGQLGVSWTAVIS